ncbi:transmembrane amino acid transporter protein-domain-containing protein [Exophiala viscosa]|uniref:Transmembrane amino acid transporter protein-domain-containing protein n=1 Tax=Exophiala viscosa TaxID=2486360 RepID=A0AAN6DSY8_9EURO|nr:transmembrane amino acid transporter protein-domain-containing protein [Exophiala viscosa]KAI1628979.1 transmembrane amino acid transporter protein-domain-containing protein [Exophiala viscosa]
MASQPSVSSGSWRKGLMKDSITSFFNNNNKKPEAEKDNDAVINEASRNNSDATPTPNTAVQGDRTPNSDETGALPPYKERDPDPTAKHDPMASSIEGGVEYKSMVWWQAGMVMVAETISLGILSLPQAISQVGIIPGLILLLALGALASYSGYVIGQFKMRYPHIHSMGCAGEVLFGRWGGEILGWGQFLFYIFVMGSHILTFSIMMNAITGHGACTIVWMVVGTILSFLCTLPRTLKNLSYYSVVSFLSIIGAVMITMIGVSITKPGLAPGETTLHVRLWPRPGLGFQDGFLAVANMVFAYAGHVAFFTFISELRKPEDFPKALALLQCSDISMYIITAVVVYYYAGDNVRSPALDSAGNVVKKVAYGIAIPTIVIAGVVNGHVGVKYLYVRLLRNRTDDLMHQKSWKSYGIWVGICTGSWLAAWLIAEAVPVFNDLLGLTSALFASWFTFGLSGMFWMKMNLTRRSWKIVPRESWSKRKSFLFLVNVLQILMGAVLCVVGLYASISSMIENGTGGKTPFSCANNAAGDVLDFQKMGTDAA